MKFINTGYNDEPQIEWLVQLGSTQRRITGPEATLTEEVAIDIFLDHVKRTDGLSGPRSKVKIAEIIAEPVEEEEAV